MWEKLGAKWNRCTVGSVDITVEIIGNDMDLLRVSHISAVLQYPLHKVTSQNSFLEIRLPPWWIVVLLIGSGILILCFGWCILFMCLNVCGFRSIGYEESKVVYQRDDSTQCDFPPLDSKEYACLDWYKKKFLDKDNSWKRAAVPETTSPLRTAPGFMAALSDAKIAFHHGETGWHRYFANYGISTIYSVELSHFAKGYNLKGQLPEESIESLATTVCFIMLNCRTLSSDLQQTALSRLLRYLRAVYCSKHAPEDRVGLKLWIVTADAPKETAEDNNKNASYDELDEFLNNADGVAVGEATPKIGGTSLNRQAPSAPELEHVHRSTYAVNEEPPTKSEFLVSCSIQTKGKFRKLFDEKAARLPLEYEIIAAGDPNGHVEKWRTAIDDMMVSAMRREPRWRVHYGVQTPTKFRHGKHKIFKATVPPRHILQRQR
ncbi:hypothetical protein RB195_023016 [Necator americanus]|uniref:Uncharacterized protein n=1 Tax=Necator americanus TaxID=51031 RepID=A0ABR1EHI3_NECAM